MSSLFKSQNVLQKKKILSVLDIGSSKVCCLISKVNDAGQMQILGIGHNSSEGISYGLISDVNKAKLCIGKAIQAAEKMANEIISSIVVNITSNQTISNSIVVELDLQGEVFEKKDLLTVINQLKTQIPDAKHELIHSFPIGYSLDGNDSIVDPDGMSGDHLEIDFHTIAIKKSILDNIKTCLNYCHIDIDYFVHSGIASAYSCLIEDELSLGTILIDIGSQTSSIAIFRDRHPIFTSVIPLGGKHITDDIATGLSTSIFDAERLKIIEGHTLIGFDNSTDSIDVPMIGEKNINHLQSVRKSLLNQIIKARVEEIFEHIQKKLFQAKTIQHFPNRIVLTGGTSQLPGIGDFAEKFFGMPVRLGHPDAIPGLANYANNPAFSTITGMLHYAISHRASYQESFSYLNKPQNIWSRVKTLLAPNAHS